MRKYRNGNKKILYFFHFFLGAVLCTQYAVPASPAIKKILFCDVKLSNEKKGSRRGSDGSFRKHANINLSK